MSLKKLATKYSVDKLYNHSYIPFYERLFANRNIKRLLEIGIGNRELMQPLVPRYVHGASLKMWRDYFPDAEIFSCDILPETIFNEDRIHSVVCNQYDARALHNMACGFGGNFDVIIDDGCHHTLAQVISFMALFPYLNNGGVYIIEDVGYPDVLSMAIDGNVHIFRKNGRWDDVLVTKVKFHVGSVSFSNIV